MLKKNLNFYLLCFVCQLLPLTILAKEKNKEITVMSYNVENLFDTTHDVDDKGKDKNDWTFLPKSKEKKRHCNQMYIKYYKKQCLKTDWTKEKLELKLKQIVKVISRANYPDFIGFQEVENRHVLEKLNKLLPEYKFFITNSDDLRGIDVALFYKVKRKLKNCSSIIPYGKLFITKKTRNILHCIFQIKGSSLHFFVNHWPSLGNDLTYRIKMAEILSKEVLKISKKDYIISMGDFNTLETSGTHPFWDVLIPKTGLMDISKIFFNSKKVKYKLKRDMAPGSYFYGKNMQWNLFDHFFISQNFFAKNNFFIQLESYKIFTPDELKKDFLYYRKNYLKGSIIRGTPFRYNFKAKNDFSNPGFSDHFPILFSFQILK